MTACDVTDVLSAIDGLGELREEHIRIASLDSFTSQLPFRFSRSARLTIRNSNGRPTAFCCVGYDSELNFPCSGAGFFYNLIAPLRGDWVPGLTSAFADFAKDADVSTIVGPIHPSLLVPRGLRESHDRLVFDGMPSNSPDLLNTLFSNGWTVERRLH
jgi:hypothetical protein